MTKLQLPPQLAADLQQVEQRVLERTRTRAAVISVAGSRLLRPSEPHDEAHPQRLRAALVLLAAAAGDYQGERVLHAAVAAELIYAATQTHYALVDEAGRRRGQPSSGEWGHGVALMVGDYLFALAAGEMALAPDPRVISFYCQAVMRFTESTLAPPPPLQPLDTARADYLERIGGTVGALTAAACMAGGACAGVGPQELEALGRFGHTLGLALQVGDEIRDLTATNNDEPPGALMWSGVLTLPLIYAINAGDGPRLQAALDSREPDELAWAVAEVARHGIAPARAEVARLADQARDALASFPPASRALLAAADYAVSRASAP